MIFRHMANIFSMMLSVALPISCWGQQPETETSPNNASGIGVARANAAAVNLAARAERRMNLISKGDQIDLAAQLEAQVSALKNMRARIKSGSDGKNSNLESVFSAMDAIDSRITHLESNHALILSAFELNAVPPPPVAVPAPVAAPASPPQIIDYKPEYLFATLNPTLVICGNGVWSKPRFIYQSYIDKVGASIKNNSLSVGLFSFFFKSEEKGMPRAADLSRPSAGTGIAIGPDLVLTNQHVVSNMVVDSSADPSQWKLSSEKLRYIIGFPVQTKACAQATTTVYFEVIDVKYAGKGRLWDDDIAVVQVRPLSGGALRPITFDSAESFSADEYLGVIGYPEKPDPTAYVKPDGHGLFPDIPSLEAYFDLPNNSLPKYRVIRFGFGTLVDLNDPLKRIIGHDAPTDNSSSGSLIISLATGNPIALHAGGKPGMGNSGGINIAYRSDYILQQLKLHKILPLQNH